jgi:hypothetical protein
MPSALTSPWLAAALCAGVCFTAAGQSVVSVRSGVVHYFEGAVSIGDRPLQHQFGKFPDIPDNGELRTADGRAEVLLTPGVILRVAENSAIRMRSSALSDTRVELLRGSAILDAAEGHWENSNLLMCGKWSVKVLQTGVCRVDFEPPRVRVYNGAANVFTGDEGTGVMVRAGEVLPLADVLVPERSDNESPSGFTDWAVGRGQFIAAENATAAAITDDPALFDRPLMGLTTSLGMSGFTYFPPGGVLSLGTALPYAYGRPYGWSSWAPYPTALYAPSIPRYGYGYRAWHPIGSGAVGYPGLPAVGSVPHAGVAPAPPHAGLTPPPPHAGITPPPVHVPPPHPHVGTRAGHR